MRATKEKMTLEDYLQFFDSHNQLDVTVKLLNEIISMHGFKRIQKVSKKVLVDALSTFDLIDPARSTLEKATSLPEIATIEDAISDLKDLDWQECCVTSIRNLNSRKENLPAAAAASDQNQNLQIVTYSTSHNTARTAGKTKKALKSVQKNSSGFDGDSASCSSGTGEKPRPRKLVTTKRKRKISE